MNNLHTGEILVKLCFSNFSAKKISKLDNYCPYPTKYPWKSKSLFFGWMSLPYIKKIIIRPSFNCLIHFYKRYQKINAAMDASQTCEFLLSSLKKSNLNFQLSESPFSVSIQIRKTFIRNQTGAVRSSGLASNLSSRVIEKMEALKEEKRELEETISGYKSLESYHIELEEENKSFFSFFFLDQV